MFAYDVKQSTPTQCGSVQFVNRPGVVPIYHRYKILGQIQGQIQVQIQFFFKPLHGDPFFGIQIQRKLKRKRKQKHSRGNLREGRFRAPLRRSLHPPVFLLSFSF